MFKLKPSKDTQGIDDILNKFLMLQAFGENDVLVL